MIKVAFCFDENMILPACVAIGSLLDASVGKEIHYNIYCICPEAVLKNCDVIKNTVSRRDGKSSLQFLCASKQFEGGFEIRNITSAAYSRLLLHKLLPDTDKIIYADVDVLFKESLEGIWKYQLSETELFAGVKGANNFKAKWEECIKADYAEELSGLEGSYINSGILLMNLQAIRKAALDEKWIAMSRKQYIYQDQDIINITCKGHIGFLDLRYNVPAHLEDKRLLKYAEEGLYGKEQCGEALQNPAIIHYTGAKPWKNRGANKAEAWWKYVDSQQDLRVLFDKKKVPYRKTTGILGKINRHLPFGKV